MFNFLLKTWARLYSLHAPTVTVIMGIAGLTNLDWHASRQSQAIREIKKDYGEILSKHGEMLTDKTVKKCRRTCWISQQLAGFLVA
jgi:hypothetical protein